MSSNKILALCALFIAAELIMVCDLGISIRHGNYLEAILWGALAVAAFKIMTTLALSIGGREGN